jgi:hypothetical protein
MHRLHPYELFAHEPNPFVYCAPFHQKLPQEQFNPYAGAHHGRFRRKEGLSIMPVSVNEKSVNEKSRSVFNAGSGCLWVG